MNTNELEKLLQDGLKRGVFPCYAAAVGKGGEIWFRSFGGYRALVPERLPLTADTLFDMASLSKLIGTAMASLRLIEDGKLRLTDTLGMFFGACYGKEGVTVRQLMTHTSGFCAHIPLWRRGIKPQDALREILREKLCCETGTQTVYSCMGYILLGKILEQIEGEPLDKIVTRLVFVPLGMKNSMYNPPASRICAATEGVTCGIVHDENAAFLGGVAGNAGIFCDLADAVRFAGMLSRRGAGLLQRQTFDMAVENSTAGCSENRGLGFQLLHFGYGHTGFTGTSLYVHPESGVYAVLLTNRVHPTRENALLMPFRRQFHEAVFG